MNKETVDQLIKKKPKLKSLRPNLEAIEPGVLCIHQKWGTGLIADYDELENKLIVDFEDEGKMGHKMDPIFCAQKLEILPSDNILVRNKNEPEVIDKMIKDDPAELIVAILSSKAEHSASSSEIERELARLIGPQKYKKWWTATKKVLIQDPRIAVPEKKLGHYILRKRPIKPEQELVDAFNKSRSLKKKIELADNLLALSVKHEDIKEELPNILDVLTEALKNSRRLNQAERLQGIWVRNDLARFIHEDPESLEPTSASIIEEETSDLYALAALVSHRHQSRFLELLQRSQPDKWEKLTFDLLRQSTGKFTNECIVFLSNNDCEKKLKSTLEKWLSEQALKEPLLCWIIKNRQSRRFSKMLHSLIAPQLLTAIFYAIDNEALKNLSSRRIPLAELLSEDAELIPELLSEATPETARDLATTLLLNQGFEDLTKKSLLARFIRLFPKVQELVSGKEDAKVTKSFTDVLIVSETSFQARVDEYETLIKEKIPTNKQAIAIAREHGDLRENAEYKMARQEQDTLLALKTQIESELARAQKTDFKDAPVDSIGIGSMVELSQGSSGQRTTYAILGAWDSNPEKNQLSYQTPLAQQLLAKKIGETVTIRVQNNEEDWTIHGIKRYIDLQNGTSEN